MHRRKAGGGQAGGRNSDHIVHVEGSGHHNSNLKALKDRQMG